MGGPVMSHITTQTTWCSNPICIWVSKMAVKTSKDTHKSFSKPQSIATGQAASRHRPRGCGRTGPRRGTSGQRVHALARAKTLLAGVRNTSLHTTKHCFMCLTIESITH